MRLNIRHRTIYRYGTPVCASIQYLRLTPRNDPGQRVIDWAVRASGELHAWSDGYGNRVHTLVCRKDYRELSIEAAGVIETDAAVIHLDGREEALPRQVYLRHTPLTAVDAAIRQFAGLFRVALTNAPLDALLELMFAIHERVAFTVGSTHSATSASEAFASRSGVCQDHAHIFIACCRELDIPARYIGGYLLTDGDSEQAAGHAWAEAWIADIGWVSFDVANTRHRCDTHVRVAVGLDYRDVSPVAGVRQGGGSEEMSVMVQVVQAQQ
jgi:transglutaminase-like putative cysteine protease